MTADELLLLPDDGLRHELVRGKLTSKPLPGMQHGLTVAGFGASLGTFVKNHNLGRTMTRSGYVLSFNPDTVRAPDVSFVHRDRIEKNEIVEGYRSGAPDLVVEVISASDGYTEVEEKLMGWLEGGCQLVMIVNPYLHVVKSYWSPEEVTVYEVGDVLNGGAVVPGWELPVDELFADLAD